MNHSDTNGFDNLNNFEDVLVILCNSDPNVSRFLKDIKEDMKLSGERGATKSDIDFAYTDMTFAAALVFKKVLETECTGRKYKIEVWTDFSECNMTINW